MHAPWHKGEGPCALVTILDTWYGYAYHACSLAPYLGLCLVRLKRTAFMLRCVDVRKAMLLQH